MNIPTKEIIFMRAEADLIVSKFLLNTFNKPSAELDLAAYHLQQAVEKLLVHQIYDVSSDYIRTHDIPMLVRKAANYGVKVPVSIKKMSKDLKLYESLDRYNSAFITDIVKLHNYYSDIEKYFNIVRINGVLTE